MEIKESPPIVSISFTIVGATFDPDYIVLATFDPDYVTSQLGIQPTLHHRKGDAILHGKGRRLGDRWQVTIGPRETIKIDEMLSELLAYMAPGQHELRKVCAELGVIPTISCAVEPTSSLTPEIFFPPDVVRWAADHNVAIDVDFMLWGDEDTDQR